MGCGRLAAAIKAKRATTARVSVGWSVWWAAFPDVLAFGPYVAGAAWLRLAGRFDASGGLDRPPIHIGLPLYPAGPSRIGFLMVFGLTPLPPRLLVFHMLARL